MERIWNPLWKETVADWVVEAGGRLRQVTPAARSHARNAPDTSSHPPIGKPRPRPVRDGPARPRSAFLRRRAMVWRAQPLPFQRGLVEVDDRPVGQLRFTSRAIARPSETWARPVLPLPDQDAGALALRQTTPRPATFRAAPARSAGRRGRGRLRRAPRNSRRRCGIRGFLTGGCPSPGRSEARPRTHTARRRRRRSSPAKPPLPPSRSRNPRSNDRAARWRGRLGGFPRAHPESRRTLPAKAAESRAISSNETGSQSAEHAAPSRFQTASAQ